MMNLGEIREHVRLHLDIDADDAPDPIIDRWTVEGYRRIIRSQKKWDYFETTDDMATLPDTNVYDVGFRSILQVSGSEGPLPHLDVSEARRRYYDTTSGRPEAWSQWDDQLVLWPTPDGAYDLRIYGYRAPIDWWVDGAGAVPDMPEHFEDALVEWVLYRAYLQQDEPELAAIYKQQFNELLTALTKDELEGPPTDVVLNRADTKRLDALGPLRYPWE